MRVKRYIELCAGGAALALEHGWRSKPFLSIQGGKRTFWKPIFEIAGLQSGESANSYLLVEPGPFGEAWTLAKSEIGRSWWLQQLADWADESKPENDPLTRWNGFARDPVPGALHERVAVFSVLQFWSYGGKLVYPVPPGKQQGLFVDPRWRWKTHGMDKADAYNTEYRRALKERGGTGGDNWQNIRLPKLIDRIRALPCLDRVEIMTTGADSVDIDLWGGPGAFVIIDPPYEGTEGYGPYKLSRQVVLQLARQWDWSEAQVLVCEAVPLCQEFGAGWYSTRIDSRQGGRGRNNYGATQEWVTTNFYPERVPVGCQVYSGDTPIHTVVEDLACAPV